MSATRRQPRTCEHCTRLSPISTRLTFRGLRLCSLRCAAAVRDGERKARLDAEDANPAVCRCAGAPRPLEAQGAHCRECRRMFSAGARLWLATEIHECAPGPLGRIRLAYEDSVRRALQRIRAGGHARPDR